MPYNAQVYLGGHGGGRCIKGTASGGLISRRPSGPSVRPRRRPSTAAPGERRPRRRARLFLQRPIARAPEAPPREGGLFTREDLSGYRGEFETPLSGSYGEYTLYTNRTWSQGAVVPLALQILEGVDLKTMGHNSPAYVHAVLQAIELAMADREAFFGDPPS